MTARDPYQTAPITSFLLVPPALSAAAVAAVVTGFLDPGLCGVCFVAVAAVGWLMVGRYE